MNWLEKSQKESVVPPQPVVKVATITRYREIEEKRSKDGGRHYLFEVEHKKKDYIGYLVNRIPYYGTLVTNPNSFYGIVADETGERGKTVGSRRVNWDKVDEVIDGPKPVEEEQVYADGAKLADTPEGLARETQPLLPNIDNTPRGHWASADGVKTADTIWTQSQVFCEDGACYDIDKLIDGTEDNQVKRVEVSSLSEMLYVDAWGDKESVLSPMGVLGNPNASPESMRHMARIRVASRDKPIICRFSDGFLIDGYHRLARLFVEGTKKINVVFAQVEQMKKARIT